MLDRNQTMNVQAVFMLSTGRAGTGTFAHVLQQSRHFNAFHQPNPEMIKEAFEVQQGLASPAELIKPKIAAIRDLMIGHEAKTYAETNNKLYPFARELDKYFTSRFIWIIRDPFEFVNSGLSRKWYTGAGGVWDENRERPRIGWRPGLSLVQKIAWQWCEINRTIEREAEQLAHVRVLHFSDLRESSDAILRVLQWLGASDLTGDDVERIVNLRINVGRYSAPRDPRTGDHIFGPRNSRTTEYFEFDRNEVQQAIQRNWRSAHSERYLSDPRVNELSEMDRAL